MLTKKRFGAYPAMAIGSDLFATTPVWRRMFHSGASKLNPCKLVDAFERLAVGCLYGEADKRNAATGPRGTSNPHCAAVGIGRPALSNCSARGQRNSSSLLSLLGSAVLDLILALVATMAR